MRGERTLTRDGFLSHRGFLVNRIGETPTRTAVQSLSDLGITRLLFKPAKEIITSTDDTVTPGRGVGSIGAGGVVGFVYSADLPNYPCPGRSKQELRL
jgi:hypothetical protein